MNTKQLVGTVLDTILKIVVIIAAVMLTYKYATNAYDFGYRVFAAQPVSSEDTATTISIAVSEEAKPMDIGKVLEEKGLIEDAKLFYIQELLSSYHGEIKPGIYELSSDMTAEEMMAVMSADTSEDGTISEEENVSEGEESEDGETEDTAEEDGGEDGGDEEGAAE